MTTLALNKDDAQNAREYAGMLSLALGAAWLLGLLTFSLPGRTVPESVGGMDWIAMVKILARLVVILGGVAGLFRLREEPRSPLVFRALVPLMLFLGWAILSTAWSPLKSVSLGQAGSLTAQLLLAALIGVVATTQGDTQRVLFHLNAMLLAVAVTLLAVHAVSPDASGLTRGLTDEGSVGFVHPTSAGATASLGIVMLLLTRLIWNPPWVWWLLVPGLVAYPTLLLLANSRTAIGMAGVILLIAVPLLLRREVLAALVFLACTAAAVYLCLDPGLELFGTGLHRSTKFLARHESAEQLQSFTGRTELWEAVWAEYSKSPLRGCGYFVTSQDGMLDVWTGPANRTAHNLFLQVLSSTGLIGLALFLWGMARVMLRSARDLAESKSGRQLRVFLLFIAIWYLGWGQLCASFMGPIQPESIVFYCCLGLALAALRMPDTAAFAPSPSGPRPDPLGAVR